MAFRSLTRSLLRALKPSRSSSSSIQPTLNSLLFSLSRHSPQLSSSPDSPTFFRSLSSLSEETLGPAAIDHRKMTIRGWLIPPSMICLRSSSGPSRFDWDWEARAWIYRRTKENLTKVLEAELEKLCGEHISLS